MKILNFFKRSIIKLWYVGPLLLLATFFSNREKIEFKWQFFGEGRLTYSTGTGRSSIREEYQKSSESVPGYRTSDNFNLLIPFNRFFRMPSAVYWVQINGKGTLKMSIMRNGKLCSEINKAIDGDERVEISCIPE
jgi:hypothetical protein